MIEELIGFLGLKKGEVISLVGGGGKTTLMFLLARGLLQKGFKVITTTTTKIKEPPKGEASFLLLGEEDRLLSELKAHRGFSHLTLARGKTPEGKLQGLSPEFIGEISPWADVVIVEADGSKGRPIKVHGPQEPVVPKCTTLFIALLGAEGLGKPFSEEWVFRFQEALKFFGLKPGDPMSPEILKGLFLKEGGLLKGKPQGARGFVFINQVEGEERLTLARTLALELKREGIPVLLGSLREGKLIWG